MKRYIILILVAFLTGSIMKATDLYVNETGSGSAYTTITAAHAAAVDGDRIFVEPKAGGAAYVESFTITKSVQILSYVESELYTVQGNITISPVAVEEIAIIGCELIGSISSTIDASTSGRTIIKILYSTISSNIDFNHNNYDVTVANCTITAGSITLRAGRIIGNDITYDNATLITINNEVSGAAHLSDTIQIIGNRLDCASSGYTGIYSYTQNYFLQINNNFIKYANRGINITDWNNNVTGTHEILNNTLYRYSVNFTNYAIYLSNITTNSVLNMHNNLIDGYNNGSTYGIYCTGMTSGIVNISYNYLDGGFDYFFTGFTNDGTNVTGASFTINTSTGQPTSGTYADVGHPDLLYYDHNLTRNDVGCYGGSYSASNYFITGDSNNNRVYLLNIPKSVYTGNPIRVEAEGFDK